MISSKGQFTLIVFTFNVITRFSLCGHVKERISKRDMQTSKNQNENNQQLFQMMCQATVGKIHEAYWCIINNSMPHKENSINCILLWLKFKNSRNFKTIWNEWMVGTQDNSWCMMHCKIIFMVYGVYFVCLWFHVLVTQNGHNIVIHNVRLYSLHINACILFLYKNSSNDKVSFQLSFIYWIGFMYWSFSKGHKYNPSIGHYH